MGKHQGEDVELRAGTPAPVLALVPQSPPNLVSNRALNEVASEAAGAAVDEPSTAARSPELPIPSPGDVSVVLASAAADVARGVSGAMATVLERHGSAPGTPGQKLYLSSDGTCVGTVGGGAVERAVMESLLAMASDATAKHEVRTFKLGAELGMCCGGRLVVLLEPMVALVPSLVVGAGHVATALAPLLAKLGFAVTVVDARDGWAEESRIRGGAGAEGNGAGATLRCVTGDFDDVGRDIDPCGVCLVMTHDHALDQRAIEWALKRGFAYVGGVGSRAKAERTRQRLEAKGFPESDRTRIRMPIGLDIGARSPDEIAIAIAAELVAWRKSR